MNRWNLIRKSHTHAILLGTFSVLISMVVGAQPKTSASLPSTPQNTSKITVTEAPANKKFSGSWSLGLSGRRAEDTFNQKSTVDFSIAANLNYKPVEMMNFNFSPRFRYLNGYAQTQNETNTNQSQWFVKNAAVDFTPADIFETSVGALDQGKMHHGILLEDIAFPALRMTLNTSQKNSFVVGINGQTAIATSSSLSTQTKEFEKTPTFNTGGIFMKLKHEIVEAELAALAWQFDNLPMSLATTSSLLGNTTDSATGGTDAKFRYQYKGYEAHGKAKFQFNNRWYVGASSAWVKNNEAPQGLNQGTWTRGFVDFYINRQWMLTPSYEFFRIESDAAVAAYNSSTAYTNAVGYRGGLGVEFKKTIRVSIYGGEKDVLVVTPYQQRERIWNLKLETLDVAI